MKTFNPKNLIAVLSLALLLGLFVTPSVHAQTALTTTTLSAALNNSATTFAVASATNIVAPQFSTANFGTGNQSLLYVDKEAMFVTGISGTNVTVIRGWGSTVAYPHVSGATVYVSTPDYISNNEKFGACTSTSLLALPIINVTTGHIFDCRSSGQWIQIGDGTMNGTNNGGVLNAYCLGTAGSAETEYLYGANCSGATSAHGQLTINSAGTLANLVGSSSANFLGTGGSKITVLKNAVATALTCSPTAAQKKCTDLTHSVAVAAGDVITITFLSATSDTAADVSVSIAKY